MKRVASFLTLTAATLGLAALQPATTSVSLAQVQPQQTSEQTAPDPRIQAALDELGLNYESQDSGAFKIGMRFDGDRAQIALIHSRISTLGDLEIIKITSVANLTDDPLSAETANRLLVDNANKKLGAWQTVQLSDQRYVTLFAAHVDINSSPDQLEAALYAVLSTADQMEAELTGGDRF